MSTSNDCRSVRGLLMLYLDSELDATATHSVNQHLVRCPECRHRFEAEQLLESALAAGLETGEEMPDEIWSRLTEKLAEVAGQSADSASRPLDQGGPRASASRRRGTPGQPHSAPRSPWRIASWLAAAAMLVTAVTLWIHDPGVPGLSRSGGLLNQLAALHRAPAVSSSNDPVLAARGLMAELSLPEALLPAAALQGMIDGHPVSLVGAERVRVFNVAALSLRYECCGVPASVYLIPRSDLLALPAEMLPPNLDAGAVEGTVDGLLTRSLLAGEVLVSVVSEHSVTLADAWSS